MIADKLGVKRACDTADVPLPGATGRFKSFVAKLTPEAPSPSIAANLARNYGARAAQVLSLGNGDKSLLSAVSQRLPDIAAQVAFAVRSEMAMTLDDVLFRRTGLGTLGPLEPGAVESVASLMGSMLGWSEDEKQRQIASIGWRYEALGRA
jgi:glycerol-3-phosphate dehydrogenase